MVSGLGVVAGGVLAGEFVRAECGAHRIEFRLAHHAVAVGIAGEDDAAGGGQDEAVGKGLFLREWGGGEGGESRRSVKSMPYGYESPNLSLPTKNF